MLATFATASLALNRGIAARAPVGLRSSRLHSERLPPPHTLHRFMAGSLVLLTYLMTADRCAQ